MENLQRLADPNYVPTKVSNINNAPSILFCLYNLLNLLFGLIIRRYEFQHYPLWFKLIQWQKDKRFQLFWQNKVNIKKINKIVLHDSSKWIMIWDIPKWKWTREMEWREYLFIKKVWLQTGLELSCSNLLCGN